MKQGKINGIIKAQTTIIMNNKCTVKKIKYGARL